MRCQVSVQFEIAIAMHVEWFSTRFPRQISYTNIFYHSVIGRICECVCVFFFRFYCALLSIYLYPFATFFSPLWFVRLNRHIANAHTEWMITQTNDIARWNNEKYVPIKCSIYTFLLKSIDKTSQCARAIKMLQMIFISFIFFHPTLFHILNSRILLGWFTSTSDRDYMLRKNGAAALWKVAEMRLFDGVNLRSFTTSQL